MDQQRTDDEIRALGRNKRLPASHLERWLEIDPAGRSKLLTLVSRLRLRTGQIVNAIEWLGEVSIREHASIVRILDRDEFRRLLEAPGSGPERAHAFIAELRALRFPRLGGMVKRLEAEIASIKLPHGIRVLLPRDLSSEELKVELTLRSGKELATALDALEKNRPALARIIQMLGGNDGL